MATPIPGDRFVRTLRHYLEANESRLLAVQPNFQPQQATIKEEPPATHAQQENGILKAVSSLWSNNNNNNGNGSSSAARSAASTNSTNTTTTTTAQAKSRPSSLYGIPIPYMSLLAAASPNATSLSNTPYMPLRSSLTLDIHYLYFLLVQFEYLGLEDTHLPVPEHGLVETETTMDTGGKAPSISSVGSVMSTLSLSTGWQFWSSNQHQKKQDRPLHEDIVYIHRYLSKVTALKLHMNILIDTQHGVTKSGQRTIRGYETPLPQDGSIALSLKCFKNLQFLELSNINPRCIDHWSDLHTSLTSLVIKSGNIDNAADIIGTETPWSELKMLSLQDNSLTTMDEEPAHLVRSITHLNLSSNLLIDIPAALASLYNLSCLNLSHNMISFTTGINTVLGNIQELDLRGNRLTVLAGLDRLWALERLDVRDNRIDDAAEIGRLTALPNINDIWVEGNPFTKLQPDYRVDIFSVFKKSDLDIDLDGTKPTFAERRRIQVPAHANSATISATIATTEPTATKKWPTAESQQQKEDGDSITSHSTAPVVTSKKIARAKTKGNKRQIRLGQAAIEEDITIPAAAAAAAAAAAEEENNKKHVHRLADLEEAVQQEQVSARRAASVRSRRSKKGSSAEEKAAATAAALSGESTKKSSEAFRKKIEAMRREAGTEWLRVLQEMDVVKKTP